MGQQESSPLDDSVPSRTLKNRTLPAVAEYITSGDAKKIVVLTGAGISTAAGIPDFRSPDTGLYTNLARLNLPYPEAVFDISFFRENPEPFYALAKELYPGKYRPTVSHVFIALLARKGLLLKLFTQNIDCLERAAGVSEDMVIEAHGSFASQRCIDCKTEYPDDLMSKAVHEGEVPHCLMPECNGLVKPDIVFFGESLPEAFHANMNLPSEADLMIIIGTSLSVQPFASLPEMASSMAPRLLINMERVGGLGSRPDDVCLLGDCDRGVRKLADELGWREELEELWRTVGPSQMEAELLEDERTRDEILEDEISKLTEEVDHTLKISTGHKEWLEKHLAKNANLSTETKAAIAEKLAPEDTAAEKSTQVKVYEAPLIVPDSWEEEAYKSSSISEMAEKTAEKEAQPVQTFEPRKLKMVDPGRESYDPTLPQHRR
jgi:NAD-dependent histone deacetylase SIR2